MPMRQTLTADSWVGFGNGRVVVMVVGVRAQCRRRSGSAERAEDGSAARCSPGGVLERFPEDDGCDTQADSGLAGSQSAGSRA